MVDHLSKYAHFSPLPISHKTSPEAELRVILFDGDSLGASLHFTDRAPVFTSHFWWKILCKWHSYYLDWILMLGGVWLQYQLTLFHWLDAIPIPIWTVASHHTRVCSREHNPRCSEWWLTATWWHSKEIKNQLNRSQNQMEQRTDIHHQGKTFQIGNLVLVKLTPYRQIVVSKRLHPKLWKMFFGPLPSLHESDQWRILYIFHREVVFILLSMSLY